MTDVQHRFIEANGIRMHIAEKGSGPLVRYGQTDAPEAIDQYTLFHLIGDMVGLLDALNEPTAVIAGHDWGAPVAWHAALMRPDRFRAVAGLSVPYRPRGPVRPTTVMPKTDDAMFYQLYFQTPGVAEAELESDVGAYMRGILYSNSGDAPRSPTSPAERGNAGMVPRGGGLGARMATHMANPKESPRLANRGRYRLLHRRVHAHRFSRRPELVSQHRPELGTARAVRRRPDNCPGPVCRR